MLKTKATFILIDPEKEGDTILLEKKSRLIAQNPNITGVLLGGSTLQKDYGEAIIKALKNECSKPIIGFPGSHLQIYNGLNAVLNLNYLNSDHPKYTRQEPIEIAKKIKSFNLTYYSCAYIIINKQTQSSSSLKETKSFAFHPTKDFDEIMNRIAFAYYSGQKYLYLEAGSGADESLDDGLIQKIKQEFDFYIIVGGGIKNAEGIKHYHKLGADAVVIGTAVEKTPDILAHL